METDFEGRSRAFSRINEVNQLIEYSLRRAVSTQLLIPVHSNFGATGVLSG